MKKILLAIIATIVVSASYAQMPPPHRPQHLGPQTPQMQNLQEVKIKALIETLNLSKSQIDDFTELYIAYDNEIGEAAAKYSPTINQKNRARRTEITYEQVNQIVQAQINLSQALIDIRSKYLSLFSKVLSPSQVLGFFQKENMIRSKVQSEYRRRTRQE